MATEKRAIGMCDECGFVYPQRIMRLSSYNTLRCPTCFDGRYDLNNHPQNKAPNVSENPAIKNARPDEHGMMTQHKLVGIGIQYEYINRKTNKQHV